MADKRIYEFPKKIKPVNADGIIISNSEDGGWDAQVPAENMKEYILGNRNFGGNGDIVTTNGQQTMTEKRLDSPKLNSSTVITTTGETVNKLNGWTGNKDDLNKIAGISTTKNDLINLSGTTANIQQQINAAVIPMEHRTLTYSRQLVVSGGAGVIITEADLRGEFNISGTLYCVNYTSITVNVYELESGNTYIAKELTGSPGAVRITKKNHPLSGQAMLDKIQIAYPDSSNLIVALTYKANTVVGA